jgi:hypothetical protein
MDKKEWSKGTNRKPVVFNPFKSKLSLIELAPLLQTSVVEGGSTDGLVHVFLELLVSAILLGKGTGFS